MLQIFLPVLFVSTMKSSNGIIQVLSHYCAVIILIPGSASAGYTQAGLQNISNISFPADSVFGGEHYCVGTSMAQVPTSGGKLCLTTNKGDYVCGHDAASKVFACTAGLAFPARGTKNPRGGYVDTKKWMSYLPYNTRLGQLSIPGTHDSAAYDMPDLTCASYNTQNWDIWNQLMNGIRYLDIRVSYPSLSLVHGHCYTGINYTEVMSTVDKFLRENPSEIIFMRIRQERSSADKTDFQRKIQENTPAHLHDYMLWREEEIIHLRGKVLFLFDEDVGEMEAMKYDGCNYWLCTNVQDDNSNPDEENKVLKIKLQIDQALLSTNITKNIYINYLSCTNGTFQKPDEDQATRIMAEIFEYIPENSFYTSGRCTALPEFKNHLGILVMDYPIFPLINKIIRNNKDMEKAPCTQP